jgi:hypothetical protein
MGTNLGTTKEAISLEIVLTLSVVGRMMRMVADGASTSHQIATCKRRKEQDTYYGPTASALSVIFVRTGGDDRTPKPCFLAETTAVRKPR